MGHSAEPGMTCLIAGDAADAEWAQRIATALGPGVESERVADGAAAVARLVALAGDEAVGDVLVLLGPVAVSAGWPDRLSALAGPQVGTVSALSVRGPAETAPEPQGTQEGEPAPALEEALPGCVLVLRSAIGLVGPPPADAPGLAAALVGFSRACSGRGLANVLATDVVASGPALETVDTAEEVTPVQRAAARLLRRTRGISVTIDGRSLNAAGAGTQVHTVELVGALAAHVGRLRVLMPHDPSPWAAAALQQVDGLELQTYDEALADPRPTDVVHRPYQLYDRHDVTLLRTIGRRIVVTHQDQLLYRNATYFPTRDAWRAHRRESRLALAAADRVVFLTAHARSEALRDGILEPARSAVVPIGAARVISASADAPCRPEGDWGTFGDRPFLLVLGADLAHKNRPFAIRLAEQLRSRHGWSGGVVMAGTHHEHGSTRPEEMRLAVAATVPLLCLDAVSEAGRTWLLEACAAVAFPSVDEGFGLVPFEAGAAGRPCLFAPNGALLETLPGLALLVPWDAAASADAVAPLLADGARRAAHVAALQECAGRLDWDGTARRLVDLYEETASGPPTPDRQQAVDGEERETRMREMHDAYWELRDAIGDDGYSLVGPGGSLPPGIRRPLLAATARRWSRGPLFAVLGGLYRLGRRSGR